MPTARIHHQIEEAAADGRLVELRRREGLDRLDGSIVSRSSKWLLLAIEYDAGLNGHSLVRVSDVHRIQPYPSSSFVERALDREGQWPLPGYEGVDLASTRAALESLAATGSLLAIYNEYTYPDECLIGGPRAFARKKFGLQNVDTDAKWDSEDSIHRYRSISRVDVGNAYERRLSAIAGPPPR